MIEENMKQRAAWTAHELEADCAPLESNDDAWNHIEFLARALYEDVSDNSHIGDVMDSSVTVARIQSTLDWLNENGS